MKPILIELELVSENFLVYYYSNYYRKYRILFTDSSYYSVVRYRRLHNLQNIVLAIWELVRLAMQKFAM